MIVNSSVVKGKCPICGAPGCSCGGPTDVVAVDATMHRCRPTLPRTATAQALYAASGMVKAVAKGKMMRIAMGRGVSVQMYEEEARRRGLLVSHGDTTAAAYGVGEDTENTENRQGREGEPEPAAVAGHKMRRAAADKGR